MFIEKRPRGGYLSLEEGDHERLQLKPTTNAIRIGSRKFESLVGNLQGRVDEAEATVELYKSMENGYVFERHREMIALRGLLAEVELMRQKATHPSMTPQYDSERWAPVFEEPPVHYPQLTLIQNTNPDFDPQPPMGA